MMYEGWRIEIQDRPAMFYSDIWIYRRGPDNKTILYRMDGQTDTATESTHEYGSHLPATLTIETDLLPLLMEALTKKGVKPPAHSFVEGKLDATERHLQDMRKMLKLN